MIPVEAVIKDHDPGGTKTGDCLRACIASMLELTVFEVPHFHDGRTPDLAKAMLDSWLAARGLWELTIPFQADDLETCLATFGRMYCADQHWILTAASLRGVAQGFDHVVVCRGDQIVHDPTYGKPHGIVGPAADGYFWASWLTRIC